VKLLVIILLLSFSGLCQNIIDNADFEVQDSCPTWLGQVYLAPPWKSVIMDADYYNCGFYDPVYPSDNIASSGTAYMSFTAYGDSTGSSEAIAQNLTSPLIPNTQYYFHASIKKANNGYYGQSCAGTFIYGLNTLLPNDTFSVHASQFSGSELLCYTATITNDTWVSFNMIFTVSDTIKSIIITAEQSPLCNQCTFIDAICLSTNPQECDEGVGIEELYKKSKTPIRIIDLMGRESKDVSNTLLIHIYSDGTTEMVYRME
jgi:hypothetical protein